MALNKRFLDPTGSGSKGTKVGALYQTADDNKAAVKGAGYFNLAAAELERVGFITIFATDATFQAKVSVAAGVVTLAAMDTFA